MLCETVKAVTVFDQFPPAARDDNQRKHEQKMVYARQDMLDAEHDISAGDAHRARRCRDHKRWRGRREPRHFRSCRRDVPNARARR